MSDEIECPYCGGSVKFKSVDTLVGYSKECSHCGREFAYKVDWYPKIKPFRYKGRTDRLYADDQKCRICKKPLKPHRYYPKCPLCSTAVCYKCERLMKPCCDEYARWAEETKEAA